MGIDRLLTAHLDNGLRVILRPNSAAPVISFWVFYRVGSRNELPGHTGISHWVEHMLFKGTERFPNGEADRAVSRAGGVFNGMTGQDWTTYFETLPSERIDLALTIESDRMANARFDPAETESERTVIISEREGSENNPLYRLQEEVQAAAYLLHSYRNPIIGWKEDLLTMTRDDLHAHYRQYYTANNAVAVLTGDFAPDAMLASLHEHFASVASGPPLSPVQAVEPQQTAERRIVMRGADPTAYFLQAFHVPSANQADFFPIAVLDAVLSGAKGMGLFGGSANHRSSRLYRALVDQQLAAEVSSSYGPTIDPGLFTVSATLLPGVEHQKVEDVIWSEILRIQTEGVSQQEVEKAIKQTKAQFVFSSESTTYQADRLGFSEVVASLAWLDRWMETLSAVSAQAVQRAATTYFRRDGQTVGWYVPAVEQT